MNEIVPKNVDAFLITNPTNIRYLTGFVGVDKRDAYLLVFNNKNILFTNSLYREQAKKLALSVIKISRDNPLAKELATVVKQEKITKLGFEEADLTVAEYNKLQKELKGVTLVPTKNRIEDMRMIKREKEIKNIRLAASLTDQCFKYITGRIRPGVTEVRLAWEIEGWLRYHGGETAFPPIVAFNEHSSQPHYHGRSNNPLRRGSLILLDFGAKINGYCADMTRVVFVGKPKDEWVRVYKTVFDAQQKALDTLDSHSHFGSGKLDGAAVDRIARGVIEKSGFPVYPHSLGHAVGLDVHESPRLTMKKPAVLKPGMVVTVEPGVYVEGAYGIRIEDLVLLKESGIEVLSKSKKDMIVL